MKWKRCGFLFIGRTLLFCYVSFLQGAVAQSAGKDIVLRFGGDCLLADHYELAVGDRVNTAFENLDILKTADIAMVNLESPVTIRGTKIGKPFNFRMNPLFLQAIQESGIDIVNLANNHIYDYDSTGLFDTIYYLDSVGIRHTGAGVDRERAHEPVFVDIKGRRIAFLGYYGGGEAPRAGGDSPGVATRSLDAIRPDIVSARLRGADYVVVNLHWGVEKAEIPDPDQVIFARMLVNSGADLIVGHHPHVLQPVEEYHGGIIAYSLGNLIFGGNSRSTYDTGILEIRLSESRSEYKLIPVRVESWRARVLEGPEGSNLVRELDERKFLITNQ